MQKSSGRKNEIHQSAWHPEGGNYFSMLIKLSISLNSIHRRGNLWAEIALSYFKLIYFKFLFQSHWVWGLLPLSPNWRQKLRSLLYLWVRLPLKASI